MAYTEILKAGDRELSRHCHLTAQHGLKANPGARYTGVQVVHCLMSTLMEQLAASLDRQGETDPRM